MKRKEIIDEISSAVLKDRQKTYGPPEQSFALIGEFWSAYLRVHPPGPLTSHDVAAMMMLMKTARLALNPTHIDSWTDAGGYAVCGGELATEVLQACNSEEVEVKPSRHDDTSLTDEEIIEASFRAHEHRLKDLKTRLESDENLMWNAIFHPHQISFGELRRLREEWQ